MRIVLAVLAGAIAGHVANEVVVDPLQAEQRAKVDGRATVESVEAPTRQVDLEAAYHACTTLTARLGQDISYRGDGP